MAFVDLSTATSISAGTITVDDDVLYKPAAGGTLTFDATTSMRSFTADSTGGAVVLSAGGTAAAPVTLNIGGSHWGESGVYTTPTAAGTVYPYMILNQVSTNAITLQALTTKGLVINAPQIYANAAGTTGKITIKCTQTAVPTSTTAPATTMTINGRIVTTGYRVDGPFVLGLGAVLTLKGLDWKDLGSNTAVATGPKGQVWSGAGIALTGTQISGQGSGPSLFFASGGIFNIEMLRTQSGVPVIYNIQNATGSSSSSATGFPASVFNIFPRGADVEFNSANSFTRVGTN